MRSKNGVSCLSGREGDDRSFGFFTETHNVTHFWAMRASGLDEKLTSANNTAKRTDILQNVWPTRSKNRVSSLLGQDGDDRSLGFYTETQKVSNTFE